MNAHWEIGQHPTPQAVRCAHEQAVLEKCMAIGGTVLAALAGTAVWGVWVAF